MIIQTTTVSCMGFPVIGISLNKIFLIMIIILFQKVMQNFPTSSSSVYSSPCLAWHREYRLLSSEYFTLSFSRERDVQVTSQPEAVEYVFQVVLESGFFQIFNFCLDGFRHVSSHLHHYPHQPPDCHDV